MEYCAGGGIIDFMNTRLQSRLTEQEILKIFSDAVEGVCWMHTRDPPLMHRDLKVENILLAGPNQYKLCDFGSTAVPKPKPAQTMQEIQDLEMDLNKHTTIQYRAPEMCDVWSRKGVGLPSGQSQSIAPLWACTNTFALQTFGHSASFCTSSVSIQHLSRSKARLQS